ncbi:MAG TPA: class I SAM-dependent methyltransferase, partial [Mycobacteriales bacterium]|nr:class I SAM-dependent methyltransferase [Mycobacteriales bacterium]
MFLFHGSLKRKGWVTAQFETEQQAKEYAEARSLTRLDSRHRAARIELLHELLAKFPEGELLDAGCGPGVLARSLLDSPAYDYRITMVDQSEAMIKYCVTHTESGQVRAMVGDIESLPFDDASFDVTISTGALEYADAGAAVRQLSRVTRPGGAVVVSMLNPLSPYWITDWFLYRPAVRSLAWATRILRIPHRRYNGASRSGIRALRSRVLRRYLRQSSLVPVDVVYFGLIPLVRPLDRIAALRRWSERRGGQLQTTRGWNRWMATGYVI